MRCAPTGRPWSVIGRGGKTRTRDPVRPLQHSCCIQRAIEVRRHPHCLLASTSLRLSAPRVARCHCKLATILLPNRVPARSVPACRMAFGLDRPTGARFRSAAPTNRALMRRRRFVCDAKRRLPFLRIGASRSKPARGRLQPIGTTPAVRPATAPWINHSLWVASAAAPSAAHRRRCIARAAAPSSSQRVGLGHAPLRAPAMAPYFLATSIDRASASVYTAWI